MALDLAPLLSLAILSGDAARANAVIEEARDLTAGRSYEVLIPDAPDLAWFEGSLIKRLVYFCEATRAPLPACAGVFVSFFTEGRLHVVQAADVIAFACTTLAASPDALVEKYGTGEVRHAINRPVG